MLEILSNYPIMYIVITHWYFYVGTTLALYYYMIPRLTAKVWDNGKNGN